MAEKQNIFLIGPMGAGKSTIGRQLAQQLRMDFFDSDHEIERRTGVNIAWIFDMEGEAGFRDRESKIIDELTQKQGIILATGGGAILDKDNRNNLSARGTVVYLKTSLEKQIARTQKDKKRPLLQTDNPENVLETMASVRNPLYESIADYIIEAEEASAKTVTNHIIKTLEQSAT